MKNQHRARPNGGKQAVSAQSAKSTKRSSGKPDAAVAENRVTLAAILSILASNKTEFGLTTASIARLLPSYGPHATPDQVCAFLKSMERDGTAVCNSINGDEFWQLGTEAPDSTFLLGLLQPVAMERAFRSAGAVLELLRCKLISDAGDTTYHGSPDYDSAKAQQLCGMLDLIADAQEAVNTASDASSNFLNAFRPLVMAKN